MEDVAAGFGPFVLDRGGTALLRDGKPVDIGQRGLAVLKALIAAEGETVSKTDLMARVWNGMLVEDSNLTVQIAALRRALGADTDGRDWIVTVPRVGYRLTRSDPKHWLDPAARVPVIAVMPFANMGRDPDQDYFADGLVEELITALSRFKSFSVIARNAIMGFKNRSIDLRTIGAELGVRYVLEGSVRRSGPKVRVTAQLTSTETGVHLWAERFEGAFADIFEMQDTITSSVIGLIEPQIRTAEIARARRKPPHSLDAYDLYLQALPSIFSGDAARYTEAMRFLERAIAIEPDYAQAMALLSWAHTERCIWNVDGGPDERAMCIAMARRAIEVGGDDPIVLAMAGSGHMTGDLDKGLRLARHALALNPNSLIVLNSAGEANKHLGHFAEALACFTRALELSPAAPDNNWSLSGVADCHLGLGRFEEAVRWARRATEAGRPWWVTWFILAASLGHLGRIDEAKAALGQGLQMRPAHTVAKLLGGRKREPWYENWIEGLLKAGLPYG